MTKKKAWQTLLWMSAFFMTNQVFLQDGRGSFLEDNAESMMYSSITLSLTEMFPILMLNVDNLSAEHFMEEVSLYLREEVFSTVDYCIKYWEDGKGLLTDREEVPSYFFETDEAKEENVQEIEEEMISDSSKTYTEDQLKDYQFLLKNFYTVDSTTTVAAGELKGDVLAAKDLSIEFSQEEPKILIYHTHGSESFADSNGNEKEETIIGVGDKLAEILENTYQIKTYHDRSLYDTINGSLDRSKAYTYAGNNITSILKKYPSIEVVIDLHRDAVKAETKLITEIDGKPTAKIMFFNGLSRTAKNGDISYLANPNKEDNLAFSFQMQLAAAELYPGFTRKIYLKGYRYNLHLKPRSLLIEVGAQTNTKEEAANAMEPLAKLLYTVLNKK